MATQTAAEKAAEKAEQERAEQERKDAETRANAPQDTAKVTVVEDPASQLKAKGLRPATGTGKQVVEADPGIEIDNDLDVSAVRRGRSAVAELESSELLTRAQAKAPNLTQEFVKQYGFTDSDLRDIADGVVPGPPKVGPIHNVELHRTPGGWQVTPLGVPVEDANKNQIDR
jgi:hypothetical protein